MLNRKTVLITGSSSGIGFELAKLFAKENVNLVLICRNNESAAQTKKTILQKQPDAQITTIPCNLENQEEIEELCKKITTKFKQIDTCIFNAATMPGSYELTTEGIEKQLAVNHLSSFIIFHKLLPLFKNSGNARLVFLSSRVFKMGDINSKMLLGKTKFYHPIKAYADSKLLSIVFSNFLSNEKMENIEIVTIHPGLIRTKIGNKHTSLIQAFLWNLMKIFAISPAIAASEVFELTTKMSLNNAQNIIWQKGKPIMLEKRISDKENIDTVLDLSYRLTRLEQFLK